VTPTLSIIMPAWNAERFIGDALGSLLGQTGVDVEVVIIDDGSSDNTAAIASDIGRRAPAVRLIGIPHGGVTAARNRGLAEARGRYITFLDADDLCPPGKLARQVAALAADPAAGAITGEILVFEAIRPDLQPLAGSRSLRVLSINLGAATFPRATLESLGGFDETLQFCEDLDLFLRLHEANFVIRIERELALLHRRHEANISRDPKRTGEFTLRALQRSIIRRRRPDYTGPRGPFPLTMPAVEFEQGQ
jgi:glycosyltransferase involved in cell wall biosynthesis